MASSSVPDNPVIPYIEGDGTGRDIWKASQRVFDAAVENVFGGKRRIVWYEVFAGEKAFRQFGEWLPQGHARRHQRISHRHQGPAHDSGGRRHSQPECGAAATAESLRLLAAGEIHSGRALAGAATRDDEHHHLPREYRRRLRRHRVARRHAASASG